MPALLLSLLTAALAAHAQAPGSSGPDTLRLPGVSLPLARHRAATLRDIAYQLELDVRDTLRAVGRVRIEFRRAPGAGDLVLDFRGLELGAVRANGQPVARPSWRDGHVVIPARFLEDGRNRVDVRFAAAIAPAGASIIRYHDATDGATYLYTLLVPSDAQQLFPGFDQPDLKARFRWTITAPPGWEVLANGAPAGRTPVPKGVRWAFRETEPISTYLAAFAAGPWARVAAGRPAAAATPAAAGPPPYENSAAPRGTSIAPRADLAPTLYLRRSRLQEADADTILRQNLEALHWFEDYFQRPFPFAKLDLLLAPAFPFGGMEHVGAIFYNESNFIFREPPTPSQRYGRSATIYHEIAHQWFGDLVTMTWFDDLWLKEGFATFMATKLQDALAPDARAWVRFYLRTKPAAYQVDATQGTVPVWQTLANLDFAKSNYGPIVYNKAPAILKQLEFLVGEAAFRDGVRLFLGRHAYANATWHDLLAAIGEAAGVDLREFGRQYILRAGMPVVETELKLTPDGQVEELALVQRPARALPDDPGGFWPMKVRVRLGYSCQADTSGCDTVVPVTLDGARTIVREATGAPAPDYIWHNDGDHGYGLFLPDGRSAEAFLARAGTLEDPLLRAMAWGALWDLVREARLDPARFIDRVIEELPREQDEAIAQSLLGRALYALERYLPELPATALGARFERLLLARAADRSLGYGLRKSALDGFIGMARTNDGRAALRDYLAGARLFDAKPIGQPSRWGAVRRLLATADPAADSLLRAEIARDSTPEASRMAFIAGAAAPGAGAKAAYFARYLDDPTLNEEWVTSSLTAFNDPLHAGLTLRYLRPALEKTEWIRDNRRIFFLPRWLEAFLEGHSSIAALAEVDDFLAANPNLPPDIRRRILQGRDELERAVRIRQMPR